MSEEEGVGFSGTRLGRSGATDGLTRRRGTPASGPPRGPATCRSGGAPSGTLGRRASGAPGTAGNPIRSAPLGRAIPRGGPPAGGPRGPTSVLAFAALPDGALRMGFPAVPGAPEARRPSVPAGAPPERHVAGPRGGPDAGVPRRRVSPSVAPDRPSRIPLKPTPSSSAIRRARRGRE